MNHLSQGWARFSASSLVRKGLNLNKSEGPCAHHMQGGNEYGNPFGRDMIFFFIGPFDMTQTVSIRPYLGVMNQGGRRPGHCILENANA